MSSKGPMLLPSEGQAGKTIPVQTRWIQFQSDVTLMDRARRTRSLYDDRSEKIKTTHTESLSSPVLNVSSSTLPMQET